MNMASSSQPVCLSGFEHINRYWDHVHQCWAAKILPGELYVTVDPDEVIATTLGSCVSACIRDKVFGIGGMNHFMLPVEQSVNSADWMSNATRYGNYAMEHLINEILKAGGRRENLELKVTGGGKIIKSMSGVGERNIEFVLKYAETEGLEVVAQDLGDIYPRKVIYLPQSGKMRIKRLKTLHNDTLIQRDLNYGDELKREPQMGEVELF